MAISLAFCQFAAIRFMVRYSSEVVLSLSTSVTLAAVLLLDPGLAMLVVGPSTLVAKALRGGTSAETLFHSCQVMFQAGTGGLLLVAGGLQPGELAANDLAALVLVPVVATAMHVVEALAVAMIVWLDTTANPLGMWRELAGLDPPQVLAEWALGLAAAVLLDATSWALPLLLLPAYLLNRSSEIQVRLREQAHSLEHQAFHDSLTGLPNRTLLMDRLGHALARALREERWIAVLFLDLDRFKVVNDSLGHEAGDQLLSAVAARIGEKVRPGDTVARIGGDEFTILLEDIAEVADATRVAERILAGLRPPFSIQGQEIFVTSSMGIAFGTSIEDDPDGLIRDADAAMYRAKAAGKARYAVFDAEMGTRAIERLRLEADLHRALDRDEFELFYQPKVRLSSGVIEGVEALVRWRHPELGLVPPDKFIPLAEETGLILPLGRWVLREACRQAAAWRAEGAGGGALYVSANVSALEFQQSGLAAEVADVLAEMRLPARCLHLEITERVVMEHAEANVATLRGLKRLGVGLAIDDFGTGYSSLSYLRVFPLDCLKIDKSFVDGLGQDGQGVKLLGAMIDLAHALGLEVVAEGVERPDQLEQLRELGCDLAQGFLFREPLPGDAARAHVDHQWRESGTTLLH